MADLRFDQILVPWAGRDNNLNFGDLAISSTTSIGISYIVYKRATSKTETVEASIAVELLVYFDPSPKSRI